MTARMMDPIIPWAEIPTTPARNPPITAPTMPTMISTTRPNPPPFTICPASQPGNCSDHQPSDDPVFHPISPLLFLDELVVA